MLIDLSTRSGVFGRHEPDYLVNYGSLGIDRDSLACEVVRICRGNYELARRLGYSYGFRCIFAWQPTIWTGTKSLTVGEDSIFTGAFPGYEFASDSAMIDLLRECYSLFESNALDSLGETSITGVFDSVSARVYTDPSGVHINALGDSLLAERIAELVTREANTD
jgi:hypothetical protein